MIAANAMPLLGRLRMPVERQVRVASDMGKSADGRQSVTLRGELSGFEGMRYSTQWQMNDGGGWINIAGATDSVFTFQASGESVNYSYRLAVFVQE